MTDIPMPSTLAAHSLAVTEQEPQSKPKIESILDAPLIVLENGGSTAMADRVLENVAKGFQHEGVSAIWRLDCIIVSGPEDGRLVTLMRPIGPVGLKSARASEAATLQRARCEGRSRRRHLRCGDGAHQEAASTP